MNLWGWLLVALLVLEETGYIGGERFSIGGYIGIMVLWFIFWVIELIVRGKKFNG